MTKGPKHLVLYASLSAGYFFQGNHSGWNSLQPIIVVLAKKSPQVPLSLIRVIISSMIISTWISIAVMDKDATVLYTEHTEQRTVLCCEELSSDKGKISV